MSFLLFFSSCKAKGISKFKDLGEMNKKESKRLDLAVKFLINWYKSSEI